jgi:prolyl-tRNA editing enzyme YbaK/EbsC (Cys-tRNA(Pro) deacylase)
MTESRHRNAERVVEAGAKLGIEVIPVRFPDGTKTAADAAAAIGCDVAQIVKSLIFAVDGEVVLAYVSGANQLDEAKLAVAAGGVRCSRVDADVVRSATGFPIGGVPPFGHDTELRVFIDPDLLDRRGGVGRGRNLARRVRAVAVTTRGVERRHGRGTAPR